VGLISVINASLGCEPKLNYLPQTERTGEKKRERRRRERKGDGGEARSKNLIKVVDIRCGGGEWE
jgi:hypothetical protein